MKTALLTLLFVVNLTVSAWARLGENADQVIARYGQPLSEIDQKGEGGKIPLVYLIFQKNGFEIKVSLSDGTSGAESFKKLNGDVLTIGEVRTLLGINTQGFGWEAPTGTEGEKRWVRDDAAVATLTGGRIFYVESKDLINKEASAQKLTSAPNLQGF
jgi:hypothetical protein